MAASQHVEALLARIEKLEAQVRVLEGGGDHTQDAPSMRAQTAVSRRRLMGMAGATAAGAIGATVLAASPSGALDPNDVILGVDSQAGGSTTTGITSSTSASTIRGVNTGTGTGVFGTATSGAGVAGFTNSGNALEAAAPFTTSGAHLRLAPAGSAGAPTAGAHTLGQFWMDSTGVLFQCVAVGTPGRWVRQTPLVLLAAPARAYDSRVGQPNPGPNTQARLAFGAVRALNLAGSLPVGVMTASALLMNLTVVGTVGASGALAVYSNGVAVPSTSSINWTTPGTVLANAVTSACNQFVEINVKCVASVGCSTDFIIDIVGYYP